MQGTGTGHDLDDLISRHAGDPAYQDVIDVVVEMMLRHDDQALDHPAASKELRRLAMRLALQGR